MITKPYKGINNIWITLSLFYEKVMELPAERRTIEPIFSFNQDRPGLINCRRTFVEEGDPTGYKWAIKYLGSWEHWERLLESSWFVPEYEDWKRELHTKLKAEAIIRISNIATSGVNEGQSLAAAKYLAEKGWERHTRGRPSKDEVKGEMKRLTDQINQTDADAERIGLKVINGGKNG